MRKLKAFRTSNDSSLVSAVAPPTHLLEADARIIDSNGTNLASTAAIVARPTGVECETSRRRRINLSVTAANPRFTAQIISVCLSTIGLKSLLVR